jgi:transcriptional regulator with XRE-family HTH domain
VSKTRQAKTFSKKISCGFFWDFSKKAAWHRRCLKRVAFMTTKLPERHQGSDDVERQLASFGARLRELRLRRGWTLAELAARSSLSRAFLSRLESGGRQASIAAALTLSRIFDVSLASLFESPAVETPCVIVRARDTMERSARGLKYAPLSHAGHFFNLQPLRVKVSPLRRGHEHYHHDGEEWIYVLSGQLTLSLADKTYDLESGDAAHFESRLPHRLIARGDRDAEVLVVAAPVWSPPANPYSTQHRAIPVMGMLPLQPGRSNLASFQRRLSQGGARRRWDANKPRRLK